MDFLDKLNYLMDNKGLNKNSLSKACDIPYTTIDGWYKKGYEGLKLPTLRKLADYFETSLDYWIDESTLDPNAIKDKNKGKRETVLSEIYTTAQELSEEEQLYILDMINTYKKHLSKGE